MINRDAEIERAIEERMWPSEAEAFDIATAAITPLLDRLEAVERPTTAAELSAIIQDWLDAEDATHFGAFEKALDAALHPKEQPK